MPDFSQECKANHPLPKGLTIILNRSKLAQISIVYMSQETLIKLECTVCKSVNYRSTKNKKTLKDRLELKKHCDICGKHTPHKETK